MSAATDNLSFAGEVAIIEVSIITTKGFIQTITNQVAGVQLFEDLFSPFLTGIVIVKESHDLLNLFPLVGEEFVRLELVTPGLQAKYTFKGEFYIYKMGDRFRINERELGYALYFMSKESAIDVNKKISKVYSGKISDNVKKLISDQDALESNKTQFIEETKNGTKHISNFWCPTENLNYLAQQAVNNNDSPSFLFFETKFGLSFMSLDTLMQMPLYQEFTWDNYSKDINTGGGSVRNPDKDYQRILEFTTPETFNYMDRVTSGMYASRMIHYDIVTKKYTDKNFSAISKVGNQTHLNEFPLVTETVPVKPNSLIINEHKYYGNFNAFGDVTNTKTVQERISLIEQMNAFKLEIIVFGRMDYSIGQTVNLRVFKNSQLTPEDDPEEYLDKIYSGKYLISAIAHTIDREKHECSMELVKESFIRELK
jgi:hypothetical protein